MKIALLTTDNREHFKNYDAPTPSFGTAPEALLQGFTRMPHIQVHVVSCTQRPMQSPEKLAANIWFHLVDVPKAGWLRTGYQGCIRAVRKKLKKIQPEIVHGQGTERDCAISAVLSGFPNVVTLHGIMREQARFNAAWPGSYYWLAARLEKFSLRRTTGVFCNSEYTANSVRPFSRKLWQVPNALRESFFRNPIGTPALRKRILLNIGTVSPRKRQLELLELVDQLHREGHSFELHFIGAADPKNSYASAFLRSIESAERAGFARYLGTKSLPELIDSLDAALALVHVPSEESFGLVVAEALARNLKFFGTSVGGIFDIAAGVESAELFPLENSAALAAGISRWLFAGCPRPQSASSDMRTRYHPDVIAVRHVEIYREVLNTSS